MRTLARIAFTVAALAAGACLVPDLALAAGAGHIHLFGGVKALDENEWEPVDSQQELGLQTSFGAAAWPVMVAVDYFHATDDVDDGPFTFTGTTQEIGLGVRKIWTKGRAHPYIGGGAAWIDAEVETEAPRPAPAPGAALLPEPDPDGGTSSVSDSAAGIWVGGGVFWRLGTHVDLGIAARFSSANVEIFGDELQAGGLHAGVLLGFGWPAATP
jgi:hypothetical protein